MPPKKFDLGNYIHTHTHTPQRGENIPKGIFLGQ